MSSKKLLTFLAASSDSAVSNVIIPEVGSVPVTGTDQIIQGSSIVYSDSNIPVTGIDQTVSPAGSIVLQDATLYRRSQTLAGHNNTIPLANILLVSGTVSSWTITQTSGLTSHWSTTGISSGYAPTGTSTGATSGYASGTYQFTVGATDSLGVTVYATLTIEIVAGGYTFSNLTELNAISGINLSGTYPSNYQNLCGKILEVARGSTYYETNNLQLERHNAQGLNTSFVTIRNENNDFKTRVKKVTIKSSQYVIIDGIDTYNTSTTSSDRHYEIIDQAVSFVTNNLNGEWANEIYFRNFTIHGPEPFSSPCPSGVVIDARNSGTYSPKFYIENFKIYRVSSGFSLVPSYSGEATIRNGLVRYYYDNGAIISESKYYRFEDFDVMTPVPFVPGLHNDGIQLQNSNAFDRIEIDRCRIVMADGPAGKTQGIFGGLLVKSGYIRDTAILTQRGVHGISFPAFENFEIRNVTILNQNYWPSNAYADPGVSPTVHAATPWIIFTPDKVTNVVFQSANGSFLRQGKMIATNVTLPAATGWPVSAGPTQPASIIGDLEQFGASGTAVLECANTFTFPPGTSVSQYLKTNYDITNLSSTNATSMTTSNFIRRQVDSRFGDGDIVAYSTSTGTPEIGGLSNNSLYYAVQANTLGFKLSSTLNGPPVTLSLPSSGSSNHFFESKTTTAVVQSYARRLPANNIVRQNYVENYITAIAGTTYSNNIQYHQDQLGPNNEVPNKAPEVVFSGYSTLNTLDWANTDSNLVLSQVMSAIRPVDNSTADSGAGQWIGAVSGDTGDFAYQSTLTTTYSYNVNTSIIYGSGNTLVVPVTLAGTRSSDTVITLTKSGVSTGSHSVTILAGNLTGNINIPVGSNAGNITLTPTNDSGLSDPSTQIITVSNNFTVDSGSISVTGTSNYPLAYADIVAYSSSTIPVIGSDTISTSISYTISSDAGSIPVSGNTPTLDILYQLIYDSGTSQITGSSSYQLDAGYSVNPETGAIPVNGLSQSTAVFYNTTVEAATLSVAGYDQTVDFAGDVVWEGASINVEGYFQIVSGANTFIPGSPYLSMPIGSFAYGFPKNPQGNSQSIIFSLLTFEKFDIGTIATINQINPGIGYDKDPRVTVYQPFVGGTNRKDYILTISNASSSFLPGERILQTSSDIIFYDVNVANVSNFIEGELVFQGSIGSQTANAIIDTITISNNNLRVGSVSGTIVANSNIKSYVNSSIVANVQSVTLITVQSTAKAILKTGNSSVLFAKRIMYNNLFTPGSSIYGESSGTTANLVNIIEDSSTDSIGINAIVDADAIKADGYIKEIEVSDSGYGYKNEVLEYVSETSGISGLAKTVFEGHGIGTGYFKSSKGFLSDNKYIHDGDYYQEYSYEVLSRLPFEKYADIMKKVLHPAGTKAFGSVSLIDEIDAKSTVSESNLIQEES